MIISMSIHGLMLAAGATLLLAPQQAHLPTSGPTTTSLTDWLTELLTDAPSIPTPNSTPNRTICARSSRARRNRRRLIPLRQKWRFVLIKKVGVCAWVLVGVCVLPGLGRLTVKGCRLAGRIRYHYQSRRACGSAFATLGQARPAESSVS